MKCKCFGYKQQCSFGLHSIIKTVVCKMFYTQVKEKRNSLKCNGHFLFHFSFCFHVKSFCPSLGVAVNLWEGLFRIYYFWIG